MATTSTAWERANTAKGGSEMPTYGYLSLNRFRDDPVLEEWLAGLDEFGMLVMLAASLPV